MTEEQRDADENENGEESQAPAREPVDPVRRLTFILLGAAAVIMVWYLVADRVTPYTAQARVHALVVPISSEVSGTVTEVMVKNNQTVAAGELLFQVDPTRYELSVETAEANLVKARQATGATSANVEAAEAQVAAARATLLRAEQDATRLRRIIDEEPGAVSERRVQSAEATLGVTQGQLAAALANLERARQDLGAEGEENVRVLEAKAALEQAVVNLERTAIRAPSAGIVTDVRLDRGNFAQAGAPQLTFLATDSIWLQADFTENNLGNIKAGDPVAIVFDALPGKVVKGSIRTAGFGVSVDSAPLGSLPTIENSRGWLREEQRFSVVVDFELPEAADRLGIRVGAQASVIVYTGGSWIMNTIGRLRMWLLSKLTYAV
ncbi:MAG: HlyD family secretion protein [Pseudomonadota bacterium]